MTHLTHHGQVVRDKEISQPAFALQVEKEVQDLGLDRHVQGRHGLVAHDERRAVGQGPRDADPLPLAAGESVRVLVGGSRSKPTRVNRSATRRRRSARPPRPWAISPSSRLARPSGAG